MFWFVGGVLESESEKVRRVRGSEFCSRVLGIVKAQITRTTFLCTKEDASVVHLAKNFRENHKM